LLALASRFVGLFLSQIFFLGSLLSSLIRPASLRTTCIHYRYFHLFGTPQYPKAKTRWLAQLLEAPLGRPSKSFASCRPFA
jgi:hypothetical protein